MLAISFNFESLSDYSYFAISDSRIISDLREMYSKNLLKSYSDFKVCKVYIRYIIIEFLISYLQINDLNVNKNKSRELRLKKRIYNLLMQCVWDLWNNLDFADTPDDTFEWGTFIDIELSFKMPLLLTYFEDNLFSQLRTVLLVSCSNLK